MLPRNIQSNEVAHDLALYEKSAQQKIRHVI